MSRTVGVNLLWMVAGDVGGTEEYATRLLAPFVSIPDVSLALFGLRGLRHAHPELMSVGAIHEAPVTGANRSARIVAERSWLKRRSRQTAVVHHFGGTVPSAIAKPSLLTIHDLLPLDDPALFSAPKARWLAGQIPASVRRAHRVLAPSAYVADQIADRFAIDRTHVHVVPSSHSGGELVDSSPGDGASANRQATLAKLGVREPYLLYPAISYHHKNHQVLVEAMAAAKASGVQLVLTGRADAAQPAIDAAIQERGLGERIRVLGRVPGPEFATLFAGASVLVFPSKFEGFGLPLIEAMRRNVPVIAADATAIPEVVGRAGLLVDPDDAGAWADAIDRVLDDDALRSDLVGRGIERAADFAPMASAERLAAIYRTTLDEVA